MSERVRPHVLYPYDSSGPWGPTGSRPTRWAGGLASIAGGATAEPRLTAALSVPLRTRNPCVQADLAARARLPCPIRAPQEAAIPVFKPDRAPRPASPFWARKARVIRNTPMPSQPPGG